MLLLIINLFLAAFAAAQPTDSGAGAIQLDRWTGLYNTDNPATIPDTAAQDCLNVETNLSGNSLLKRPGYQRITSLAIATASVTGSARFTTDSGNETTIVCHDHQCDSSTNDEGFTKFLSTGTAGLTYWTFATVDGDLYMANDKRDSIAIYNGVSLSYSTPIPHGSLLELTDSRLVVADLAAPNSSRVWYSKEGAFTNFNTGTDSVDAFYDDLAAPGSHITALKFYEGRLYIFKDKSITICEINDQYTSRCETMRDNLGTIDPLSLVSTAKGLYFRATDGHYWGIRGAQTEPISRQIEGFIRVLNAGKSRSQTISMEDEWNLGTETPLGSWDTETTGGSIFPSSVTFTATVGADFSNGTLVNVSTTDVPGSLVLSSRTWQDNFEDGNYTAGPMTWTVTAGAWDISSGYLRGTDWTGTSGEPQNYIYTVGPPVIDLSSGSWEFTYRHYQGIGHECGNAGYRCFEFRFMEDAAGWYYALQLFSPYPAGTGISKTIRLVRAIPALTTLTEFTVSTYKSIDYKWKILRSSVGVMDVFLDDVWKASATDTNITSSIKNEILAKAMYYIGNLGYVHNYFDNIYIYQYYSSGTWTSPIYNTAFTTPTWGPFSADITSTSINSQQKITFQVRASTDPDDTFESWVNQTNDAKAGTKMGRYVQYKAIFETEFATQTPRLNSASISAATTGQYVSQCITPASGITGWGLVSCAETKAGAGSLVYYTRSDLGCSYLSTGTWTAQTNSTNVAVSTGTAVQIRFNSLLGSATDQAQVDACTFYWNEGTPSQPVWGTVNADETAIYWTATTTNSTTADRLLKYDHLGNWWPMAIGASALLSRSDGIFFGSSSGGYWNKYAPTGVYSDNGSAINAYWISKDFGMGKPFQEKKLTAISLVAKNEGGGSLNALATFRNGVSKSWAISLSTTSAAQIRSNYTFPLTSPDTFVNLNLSNRMANQPFEVLGLRMDYWVYPWRVLGP